MAQVKHGIRLDPLSKGAEAAARQDRRGAIARHVYGVDDEVYQAILYHTTGRANMTLLEKILYLADYIEPSREFANDPDVVRLRETVYEDLDRGLLLGLTMTVTEMEGMGNPVHHDTLDARNDLIEKGVTL